MSFADFADLIQGKAIAVQKAWEAERLENNAWALRICGLISLAPTKNA